MYSIPTILPMPVFDQAALEAQNERWLRKRAERASQERRSRERASREVQEARSRRASQERTSRETRKQHASHESAHHQRTKSRRNSETSKPVQGSIHSRSKSQIRSDETSIHRRSGDVPRRSGDLPKRSENKPPTLADSRPVKRSVEAKPATSARKSSPPGEHPRPAPVHFVKTTLRPSSETPHEPPARPASSNTLPPKGSLSLIWAFTELRLRRLDQGQSCVHYDPSKDTQECKAMAERMHHSFVTLQYADPIVRHEERIAHRAGGRLVGSCAWWRACFSPGQHIRKNERDLVALEALREHDARKQQGYRMNAPMAIPPRNTSVQTQQPCPEETQFQPMPTLPEDRKASHVTEPGPLSPRPNSVCSEEEKRKPQSHRSPLSSSSGVGSDSDSDPAETKAPEAAHVQVPQGLHALHFDPVLPVAPGPPAKFDVSQTWLKAPKPLSPKLHHLDDDMPGAYPSPLPFTAKAHDLAADEAIKAASAPPVEQNHRLSDDIASRPGSPGPGMQNHRLSDDMQLPTAPPPVAVRYPSATWSNSSGAAGKNEETKTAHELGADGDNLAPTGEQGIEMHRLGADMLTSTRM